MANAAENLDTSWTETFSDEHKESLSGFENQDKLFEAIGYKVPEAPEAKDWREGMGDDLKKTADRFTSADEAIRSIQSFQKREGQVRVPGKDATDDEVSAYHKAVGVPDTAEGYEFKLIEGEESTPAIEAANKVWGERLHGLSVSTEIANELVKFLHEDVNAAHQAEKAADEAFVKSGEDALKAEWKGHDYEKNKAFADKAFTEIASRAGVSLDELKHIETKNGRFLMDDPRILKLFSIVGREMEEGSLGPTLTDSERDTMEDQLSDIQKQIDEAQSKGDSKRANKLYETKLGLIAKKDGNTPIVGSEGRAA